MSEQHDPADDRTEGTSTPGVPTRRRVRRTANFGRFILTGGVLGLIVGIILASAGPSVPDYSERTGIALISVLTTAFGALLGAIVGLVLERLLNRE